MLHVLFLEIRVRKHYQTYTQYNSTVISALKAEAKILKEKNATAWKESIGNGCYGKCKL